MARRVLGQIQFDSYLNQHNTIFIYREKGVTNITHIHCVNTHITLRLITPFYIIFHMRSFSHYLIRIYLKV